MATSIPHEPTGRHQTKKATASGWIGSVLEYYDFFIYATAASLIFPQIFFPKGDPTTAIVASLATYGVGYVARPIGAFFLGHWGDTHGRKQVLLICMFLMGISTMAVGLLPTYDQVGLLAPALLVVLRLMQGFAVAGEISGASSMILEHAPFGRRGFYGSFTLQGVQFGQILAAAVFLPLAHYMPEEAFNSWGWRIPFLLSFVVIVAGYIIRREVDETPAFAEEDAAGKVPKSPVMQAITTSWKDMLRVICMALMNVIPVVTTIFGAAYAVQASYGIGFSKDIYLWIPVLGNCVAVIVIPYVGSLSDKIGRRPPIIMGALGAGILSFAYLYAISIKNVPLAIALSLLMWGVVYQGYNAVYPSFYPELFRTRNRVSAMAISQNLGTLVTAMLPALFTLVAPPGSTNIWLTVGAITFGVTVIAALAAYSARETHRIHMNDLGDPNAVPVPLPEYERLRELDRTRLAERPLSVVHALFTHPAGIHMISGKTLLIGHLGYPTEAFKAPMIYNPWFEKQGIDAVVIPMGVKPEDYAATLKAVFRFTNIRGALVTMPHKVATMALVDEVTPTARIAGACNAILLRPDGTLLGDQFDGAGFVRGVQRKGLQLAGARALVSGSGGVGSAIAASLAAAGVAELMLHDNFDASSQALAGRLREHYPGLVVRTGSNDPAAFDLIVNATPLGMRDDDALPFDVARIESSTFVGEVVMKQAITPLLAAAQRRGCRIQMGTDMLFEMIPAYLEFFGFGTATADELRAVAKIAY